MASSREEGPVYYREIQKNAYLKRIPNEVSGSKLRPLSNKKVPLKSMWTQFCVHNGRTPYLEQYPDAESPATACHAPVWRACLRTARHVTASVKPHTGDQYDFLVDTDNGAVRMLAPDWDTMQDWVTTLRNTLHELKIMGKGENVYMATPAPPAPRAAARDPTSPLPPTPPVPPDRVPGIELTPNIRPPQPEATNRPNEPAIRPTDPTRPNDPSLRPSDQTTRSTDQTTRSTDQTTRSTDLTTRSIDQTIRPIDPTIRPNEQALEIPIETLENNPQDIDISNWDTPFSSLPSTSHNHTGTRGVTKICGQNICLDDSIFKRTTTDSDDEFFAEIDKIDLSDDTDYKQRVLVSNEEKDGSSENSNRTSNITVIQVSNKEPPHTAIPVIGPETDVFDFEFKQKFVNIVNTEQNEYGTTFSQNENNEYSTSYQQSDKNEYSTTFSQDNSVYGHLSLTTTVNLNGPEPQFTSNITSNKENSHQNEDLYEKLCLASTSNPKMSPLPVKKLKNVEKTRKSSLPNLEIGDSTYEYLFLGNNNSNTTVNNTNLNNSMNNQVSVTSNQSTSTQVSTSSQMSTNVNQISNNLVNTANKIVNTSNNTFNQSNQANNTMNTGNNSLNQAMNTMNTSNHTMNTTNNIVNTSHNTFNQSNQASNAMNTGNNIPNQANNAMNTMNTSNHTMNTTHNTMNTTNNISNSPNTDSNCNGDSPRPNIVTLNNPNDPLIRLRTVERSRSQNAFDSNVRQRERDNVRRVQNNSPKREVKNQSTENTATQNKPLWKRGLTEFSLLSLSRLRAIKQSKRRDSPPRNGPDRQLDRNVSVTSPVKVVHRSRPENRIDTGRRRSSSLSNGQSPSPAQILSPGLTPGPTSVLTPLRARQAAALQAEQRRGAALAGTLLARDGPVFADYDNQVWLAWWGAGGTRAGGRAGDRVAALRGRAPRCAAHARQLLQHAHAVDILFHRVPLAKIYVINKRDQESLGLKLDNECNIVSVDSNSVCARASVPPPGAWGLTEINNRPINLLKGGEDDMNRLSRHGTEVSILIQPSALVKKLRAALKGNKTLLGLR